jgi:hypothetical protein
VAGRFRLYADANIHGPVIDGLIRRGWDLVRAVDAYPEGTDDDIHFERAATEGRVLVSNDMDMKNLAEKWFEERRHFTGLIWWPKEHHRHMRVGDFLAAFEELAEKDDPFQAYPIVHIKPKP